MSDAAPYDAKSSTLRESAVDRDSSVRERVTSLYESYREAIYRFLINHGLPPATAQDLAQDVFVRLFVALSEGGVIESEKAWLYGVAAKVAVNFWRREGRPMWVELDGSPVMTQSFLSNGPTPEAAVIEEQRVQRVMAAMDRLPEMQRLGIHLRMQGLNYRAIAKALGVSLSTTSELLSTAVEHLRSAANE